MRDRTTTANVDVSVKAAGHRLSSSSWRVSAVARPSCRTELRVLTYNIHHGEGVDGKFDLPRIAEVIKSVSPHVVALQEVDQQTARSSGVDQPAELSRLTGMEVVFGRNIDFQGGGYGTAVLSTLPVKAHSSVKLPSFYDGERAARRADRRIGLAGGAGPGVSLHAPRLPAGRPRADGLGRDDQRSGRQLRRPADDILPAISMRSRKAV